VICASSSALIASYSLLIAVLIADFNAMLRSLLRSETSTLFFADFNIWQGKQLLLFLFQLKTI